VVGASLFLPFTGIAAQLEPKGTIVAAGFGYQIGDTSTITVKVYDPRSGAVLSDDTFELNVKEESQVRSTHSQDRIFAGGVGPDATDLSNFVLRVYDAQTGKFQWQGQLNLMPRDGTGAGQLVSTVAPRRATISKIAIDTTVDQPSFLLRALDSSTGGLVWEDEFSTGGKQSARVERITNRPTSQDETATGVSHTFDFRIRMFDRSGQGVLWEDLFAPQVSEEETYEIVDDQAHMLPVWPGPPEQDHSPEEI